MTSPLNPLSKWRGEKGLGVVWGEVFSVVKKENRSQFTEDRKSWQYAVGKTPYAHVGVFTNIYFNFNNLLHSW
jgi:hypothetical protein